MTGHHVETARPKGTLTHSRMSCFRSCHWKHYLKYELGIRKEEGTLALRVGSAVHLAFDLTDKGVDIEPDQLGLSDPYDIAMAMAMFKGHVEHYQAAESDLEVVASEHEFSIPLINPDTDRQTPNWVFGGKIDRIVKLQDGRLALMEYKTTSHDFAPGAEYWQKLHMDQQLSIYVIAARAMGYPVETTLYDVTRRPALRYYKVTPSEKRKYKKDGSLYARQRTRDETPDEYFARVMADIDERPEYYFSRIEIPRLDQDLDDCRAELWQQQKDIRESQKTKRWYRNPDSCYGLYTCEYLPICLNRDLEELTPTGFVRDGIIHPELDSATI